MVLFALLTIHEVAEILHLSTVSVRRLIWAKKIPAHRIGRAVRVSEADVSRVIRESRVPADPTRALPGAMDEADVLEVLDNKTWQFPKSRKTRRTSFKGKTTTTTREVS